MREETPVCFGPFHLDVANEQLWQGPEALKLTGKAFAVLRYLVEHSGQLVTKEDLFTAVWPEVVVSDAALTVCIRELRRALGDGARAPHYIETVHGRGYRWIALLTAASPLPGSEFKVQGLPPTPSPQHPAPTLVGRETELAQLHRLLDKALHGERQLVFVTGEPGIGKTTLIDAFVSAVHSPESAVKQGPEENRRGEREPPAPSTQPLTPSPWIGRGQCIDLHGAGEPYMPVLEALSRLCRGPEGDAFIAVLHHSAPTWLVQLPTVLSPEELAALQPKVQGATRERMLRELAEALEALTTEHPLVLVLEDLHWSDPSTVDLLATLARRREPARLLVLGTYRPAEVLGNGHPLNSVLQELQAHHLCEEVELRVLTAAEIETYLHHRFPTSALPTDLAHALWQRTGGNPLFLVNIVDDLVARGLLVQEEGSWTLHGGLEAVDEGIPKSIRQLLARQSARLHPAEQQVLEAASMAGMEFSAAAVAAALEESTVTVEAQCTNLVTRQQFLRPAGLSEWPDGTLAARYAFLHALYQQLWHERVSPSRLQQFHLRIGERKEAAYGAQTGEIAAELALHFEQGRDYHRATHYLQQAAQNAKARSANTEAIGLLTKALELLKTFPNTPERAQQELRLQVALGAPLMATKGYSAPEVEHTYARSRELCRQSGETPQLFPVLFGLTAFHIVRGEFHAARELSEQLLRLAQRVRDPALLVPAHQALGQTLYFLGELVPAREHLEQSIAVYDPQRHHSLALVYGTDQGVHCLGFLAYTLWNLGYPDQALKRIHEALALAQDFSHSFSRASVLGNVTAIHLSRREVQATQKRAEEAIALCTEQGFAQLLAIGTIRRGWALAQQGQIEKGISQIRQGVTAHQASGAVMGRSYYLTMLAEAHERAGQAEEGLIVLAEALDLVDKSGRVWEAELYRLKGELVLQSGVRSLGKSKQVKKSPESGVQNPKTPAPNTQEAETCFRKAIEISRRQSAKSLELRAVTSLSRLWQQQGKKTEAHQMLAEIYGWFTEGFDTKDLQEAKALLAALS